MTGLRSSVELDVRSRAVGTTIFLGSWMILFVGLLISCAALRSASGNSVSFGATLPLWMPGLATLLLVISSLLLHRGFAGLAALAGVFFLLVQIATWRHLRHHGWSVASHLEAAALYTLTIFHAVHVGLGVGGLVWGALQLGGARQFWSAYWHVVGVAWLLLVGWIYLS